MEQTVARNEEKTRKNINLAINFFHIIYLHLWVNLFIFLFVWVSGAVFNSIPIMLIGSNYTLYVICKYTMDSDALLMSLISFVIMHSVYDLYTLALTPNHDLKRSHTNRNTLYA